MKQLYTTLFAIITLGHAALAQPTLTSANCNPAIGMSFTFHGYDATAVGPGTAGANQTWDFSAATSISSVSATFINPASANNAGLYPTSNLAVSNVDLSETYYLADNDEFSYVGFVLQNEQIFDYYNGNPREVLKFPITYQDVFNVGFSGTQYNSISQTTINRGGSITIDADGYGTLITPFGTFNDILRIKVTTLYADSFGGNQIAEYQDETYLWYSANTATHYFSWMQFETIGIPNPIYGGNYLDPATISTEDMEKAESLLAVFPNPANSDLTIAYNVEGQERVCLSIFNAIGQKIMTVTDSEQSPGLYNEHVDVSGLSGGLYFVKIEKADEVITKKLTIR